LLRQEYPPDQEPDVSDTHHSTVKVPVMTVHADEIFLSLGPSKIVRELNVRSLVLGRDFGDDPLQRVRWVNLQV
jgi:hypothetical protein